MPSGYRPTDKRWGLTEAERRKRNAEIIRLYNLPGHPYSYRKLREKFGLTNISQIVNDPKWKQEK